MKTFKEISELTDLNDCPLGLFVDGYRKGYLEALKDFCDNSNKIAKELSEERWEKLKVR